jgi:hypothetical protein
MSITNSVADASAVPETVRVRYERDGLAQLSDTRLVATIADTLAVPRADPVDSFVLHAPLELVTRAALLPYVHPDRREGARLRIAAIADQFEAFGPGVDDPGPAADDSLENAATRLTAAIARGELDDVDRSARWLGRAASGAQLRALLADEVAPSLAAAAHASIFLFQLPRIAPRREVNGELLRGLARELARYPDWRLAWIGQPRRAAASPDDVFDAIAATPMLGTATGETPFIFPLMSRVDAGIAAGQLASVTRGDDIGVRGHAVLQPPRARLPGRGSGRPPARRARSRRSNCRRGRVALL